MKKFKINGREIEANSIADAIKLSDSDKLHQMAYKLAQMGNYFDRANSAQSRYVLAREDDTKLNEFYKYALQVYDQLKKEVDALQRAKGNNESYVWVNDNETVDLLTDAIHNLYWAGNNFSKQGDRIRDLAKKMDALLKVYKDYAGKRRVQRWDSITDSAASDIVREIKSKYPQVKVRQIAKQRNNYHQTTLKFSNYPGEGASGFTNDPRTKDRDNWVKLLKYLYTKYTGEKDDIDVYYDTLNIYEDFANDSVKDASRAELINEAELAIKHLKNKSDKNALEYFEDIVKLIKYGVNDSI